MKKNSGDAEKEDSFKAAIDCQTPPEEMLFVTN